MVSDAAVWWVIGLGVVLANLPFINHRIFVVGPERSPRKSLGWRALELVAMWGATMAAGFAVEARIGQIHAQGWQFYAAFGFLFLTLAFPGFVWRYLRRST